MLSRRFSRPSAARLASAGLLLSAIGGAGACEEPASSVVNDVGLAEPCEAVARWSASAADREIALLDAVNRARAVGGTCGETRMLPSGPLALRPELRCAARIHAEDLADTDRSGHDGSDGSRSTGRTTEAGYTGVPRHEVIARDQASASAALAAWLDSENHCLAVLDERLDEAGVGVSDAPPDPQTAWVLLTGESRT